MGSIDRLGVASAAGWGGAVVVGTSVGTMAIPDSILKTKSGLEKTSGRSRRASAITKSFVFNCLEDIETVGRSAFALTRRVTKGLAVLDMME